MECPHPKTSKPKPECGVGCPSADNLVARIVDIKSIVWKISGGYHHEVWVDPSGVGTKWHRYGQRDSNFNSEMA
jgi:hypothetical protein